MTPDDYTQGMNLITKVSKAVEAHIERLNVIDRSLRFLPHSNYREQRIDGLENKIRDQIVSGRIKPADHTGMNAMAEHLGILRNQKFTGIPDGTEQGQTNLMATMATLAEEKCMRGEPTTFISGDIVDMLEVASETLECEPLRTTDIISPCGFIYLERPLVVEIGSEHYNGSEGETVGIRAMSWRTSDNVLANDGTNVGGLCVYIYSDAGCLRYITGGKHLIPSVIPDSTLRLLDTSGWAYNQPWREPEEGESFGWDGNVVVAAPDVVIQRNFMLSLFRFMWQELLVRERPTAGELPRSIRRGATRTLGLEEPITILKLRRTRTSSGATTGDGSRLDHRVLVRGHWRNQYYPSLGHVDSPESHRLIWIEPHVKGPEGADFKTKPKATAVVR